MCLAVPGQIESMTEVEGLRMATVNFGGIRRSTCLEYTPEARVGDYVLVHVGFAISIINKDEALRQYDMLKMSGEADWFEADGVGARE